jgi:hypothetical protein
VVTKYWHHLYSAKHGIVKSSFDICILAANFARFDLWGTQWRCFTTKPIKFVNRHHTVAVGMYFLFAILHTDENSCSLNVVRITWLKTSEPLILASPLCPESKAILWDILWQSSRQLHQKRWLQQVVRGSSRLIILAYRERDKSSAGPLCMTSNLHVMTVYFAIEIFAIWWTEKHQSNYLGEINYPPCELSETVIVWSITIYANLPRWVLEFVFHWSLSPECEPFGKLNRSNRFRIYDLRHNYFLILYLKIH